MNRINKMVKWISFPIKAVLIGLIFLYRYLVSPVLHALAPGSGCRFQPTCSEYAVIAIRKHGPFKGTWLAIRRLSRCHPWGDYGYDPVPDGCSCTNRKDHQHPSTFGPSGNNGGSTQIH